MDNTKALIKGLVVLALVVILLVPALLIQIMIKERKARKADIVEQFSRSWAQPQSISAPFIYLQYTGAASSEKVRRYVMAEQNTITTQVTMQEFSRSIFKIPGYKSINTMNGAVNINDITTANTQAGSPETMNSYLLVNITDIKGIIDNAILTINDKSYNLHAVSLSHVNYKKFIGISLEKLLLPSTGILNYSIKFQLNGTEKIHYLPTAIQNTVSISAAWKDPSFEGSFLTTDKKITDTGFQAKWQISSNQTSINKISDAFPDTDEIKFGVTFHGGVDAYAKTLRCAKYAVLFIALTFAFFYFIELLKGTSIHPVQYFLIGIALIIFYTLLLSISEITQFNIAYAIASMATISLIAYYASFAMKSKKNGITVGITLTFLYGFIFFIIHLEDTALLVGSIGLFIILAIIMQLSKKINWGIPKQP